MATAKEQGKDNISTPSNFGQNILRILKNIFSWFRGTPLRMYYGLAFCWNFILFLLILTPTVGGFGIVAALIISIFVSLYVTAIVGPLKKFDEGWRKYLSEHDNLWWMGFIRLTIILLPYWVYGWVPDKLLDAYFYRYVTTRQQIAKVTNKRCPNCREEIKSGAEFCVKCGMAVTK